MEIKTIRLKISKLILSKAASSLKKHDLERGDRKKIKKLEEVCSHRWKRF